MCGFGKIHFILACGSKVLDFFMLLIFRAEREKSRTGGGEVPCCRRQ
jgi:hypothetical protein